MTKQQHTDFFRVLWFGPSIIVHCPRYTRVCPLGYFCYAHPHCVKATKYTKPQSVVLTPQFFALPYSLKQHVEGICKTCNDKVAKRRQQQR